MAIMFGKHRLNGAPLIVQHGTRAFFHQAASLPFIALCKYQLRGDDWLVAPFASILDVTEVSNGSV